MRKRYDKSQPAVVAFKWNAIKDQCALLIAEGELSDGEIAAQLTVDRTSVWEWRQRPEFVERIDAHIEVIRKIFIKSGIGLIHNRVKAYQDRWRRMKRLIEERASDPLMEKVAGGTTGLLAHDMKSIGSGTSATAIDVYEFDAALLKEMRELEKQAAQDMGQWTEKADVTSAGKPLTVKVLRGVSMDDL